MHEELKNVKVSPHPFIVNIKAQLTERSWSENSGSVKVKRECGDVPRSERLFKYTRMDNGKQAIDLAED